MGRQTDRVKEREVNQTAASDTRKKRSIIRLHPKATDRKLCQTPPVPKAASDPDETPYWQQPAQRPQEQVQAGTITDLKKDNIQENRQKAWPSATQLKIKLYDS